MKVAGLFSGIGGLELPFEARGATTTLICDSWDRSQMVLRARFPHVRLHGDIRTLKALPRRVDVVTAGFPCTDLSQAGRTAGITGKESGLVSHVFRLLEKSRPEWLVLENVRNMLVLDKGLAMRFLTSSLESLGFKWAYRLVDSRFSGVPQRRHRVLFVASRTHDPRRVLFSDNDRETPAEALRDDAFGFYWTEGLKGLGWARDGVPPLKGGSSVGIPSPPAIWIPGNPVGRKIVTPRIEAAESLQGFERGWTSPAVQGSREGLRWKLVGNAVTVGVADWLVGRLFDPGEQILEGRPLVDPKSWPNSAYGEDGRIWEFEASSWPIRRPCRHLLDDLGREDLKPLSQRATAGFLNRASRSTLRFDEDFLRDLRQHAAIDPAYPMFEQRELAL